MKKTDIEKAVKEVEADMGHECPDLAGSIKDMLERKAKAKHTPEQIKMILFRKKTILPKVNSQRK